MRSSFVVLLALAAILFIGCNTEDSSWEYAQSKNTISGYEKFVEDYPDSPHAAEAKDRVAKLPTFAKVVAEHPETLASQESYHDVKGPVWVFEIKFKEVNGIEATVDHVQMKITALNGKVWGDQYPQQIYDNGEATKIRLAPYGTGSYTSWVNDPSCGLCGGTMNLDYTGTDRGGKPVTASVSFTLAK